MSPQVWHSSINSQFSRKTINPELIPFHCPNSLGMSHTILSAGNSECVKVKNYPAPEYSYSASDFSNISSSRTCGTCASHNCRITSFSNSSILFILKYNARVCGAQHVAHARERMAKPCPSKRGVLSVRVRITATNGLTALSVRKRRYVWTNPSLS